jgi:hypothetical protein
MSEKIRLTTNSHECHSEAAGRRISFFDEILRCAAQKQNSRPMPDAQGSPSFRASSARPGIQEKTLDSRLRGNDEPADLLFLPSRLALALWTTQNDSSERSSDLCVSCEKQCVVIFPVSTAGNTQARGLYRALRFAPSCCCQPQGETRLPTMASLRNRAPSPFLVRL